MPSTKGMFLPINKALKKKPTCIGLGNDSEISAALLDLAVLVGNLSTQATQVKQLVPDVHHCIGYCDTCTTVAGGIWMSGEAASLRPIVWQVNFPHAISSQVVLDKNPRGCLTNLDLELAAVLLQYMILNQQMKLPYIWLCPPLRGPSAWLTKLNPSLLGNSFEPWLPCNKQPVPDRSRLRPSLEEPMKWLTLPLAVSILHLLCPMLPSSSILSLAFHFQRNYLGKLRTLPTR
jgi:hypothetical protein